MRVDRYQAPKSREKLARDVYLQFGDLWNIATFDNIAASEQRHMATMLGLLQSYQLPHPVVGFTIGEFLDPALQQLHDDLLALGDASALSALQVGGLIEEVDMRDIVAAIERSQHADIGNAYLNLPCGSRNHLRALPSARSLRYFKLLSPSGSRVTCAGRWRPIHRDDGAIPIA